MIKKLCITEKLLDKLEYIKKLTQQCVPDLHMSELGMRLRGLGTRCISREWFSVSV